MHMFSLAAILFLVPLGSRASSLAPLSPSEARPIPAQAEVSAVKSPVKLTLSVYKTELKLQDDFKTVTDFEKLEKDHPSDKDPQAWVGIDFDKYEHQVPIKVGEPLWIKISLKNVGKKTMFVLDDLFTGRKNFRQAIGDRRYYGVKVVITGPDGKDVPAPEPEYIPSTPCPEGMTSRIDPVGTAKAAAWRKEGKTEDEINSLLEKDLRDEEKRKKEWEQAHRPIIKLEPGETTTTRPWHKVRCYREYGSFPPRVGDFSELWDYHLDLPGIYKIKAVYIDDPYRKSGGKEIRFETPTVKITVVP